MRLISQNYKKIIPLQPLCFFNKVVSHGVVVLLCLLLVGLNTLAVARQLPNISSDDDEPQDLTALPQVVSKKKSVAPSKEKNTKKVVVDKQTPVKAVKKIISQPVYVPPVKPVKKRVPLPPIPKSTVIHDQLLHEFYKAVAQGQSKLALNKINQMINLTPNYKLLYMMRADLLVMMSQKNMVKTVRGVVPVLPNLTVEENKRFQELHREARLRMGSRKTVADLMANQLLPKSLIKLADNEPYAIVVDGTASRLYVYKNQAGALPKLVKDFYATQGKSGMNKLKEGDNRTPVGVYFTTGRLADKLSDFYGSGALPLDYPNVLDKSLGRTGHGIWLHGSPPDTYARSPYASEGCVVLSNPDMESLLSLPINESLPVVVTNSIEWVDASEIESLQEEILPLLDKWKRLPNNNAVKIDASSIVAIDYPSQSDLLLIKFKYVNALGITAQKQLYWKKDGFSWQLILDS